MNKILHINLGGVAFTIDEDAYEALGAYISNLKRHFADSSSGNEIITDIESRMAELLSARISNGGIVTKNHIDEVIQIMGTPVDFDIDTTDAPKAAANAKGNAESTETGSKKKRLYRNPDDKIIGGVCSGLSAYFGVSDPIWFRLGFVAALFLTIGSPGFLYIILMIIIPKAETTAQKLEMRGEEVNVDSLSKQIESKANELGDELTDSFKKLGKKGSSFSGFLSNLSSKIGPVAVIAIKAFLLVVGGSFLLSLIGTWVSLIIGYFASYQELTQYFFNSAGMSWVTFFFGVFALGIPIVWLGLLIMRIFRPYRLNAYVGSALGGLWAASLIGLAVVAAMLVSDFRSAHSSTQKLDAVSTYTGDTLKIERIGEYTDGDGIQLGFGGFNRDPFLSHDVVVTVERTDSSHFELLTHTYARGRNNARARQLAESIQFQPSLNGRSLSIPAQMSLGNADKWRGQRVDCNLAVPVGKYIVIDFGDRDDWSHFYLDFADGTRYKDCRKGVRVFKMTRDGLVRQNGN